MSHDLPAAVVWEALDELLELPSDEREARLAAIAQGRPGLERELRSLLEDPPPGFLDADTPSPWLPDRPAAPPEEPAPGLVLNGKYLLHERVGAGAMGVVFRGQHLQARSPVAIKMLHAAAGPTPAERERLLREARAASSVRHEHVVRVYDVGEHEGRPYLVMEWAEGVDLHRLLARAVEEAGAPARLGTVALRAAFDELSPRPATGPFWERPYWEVVATIAARLASAVQAAHERGLVHRDIGPKNVLLTPEGRPLLLDFGLATLARADGARTTRTEVAGTLPYMAPEQLHGRSAAKRPGVDVYALGATVHHLATGRPPFEANDPAAIVQQLPPKLRELRRDAPRDLEAICFAAMEKRVEVRYPSAAALADDLSAFLERRPVSRRMPGPIGRAWRWCQRRPAAALALAATLALLGVGASAAVLARREAARVAAAARDERFAERYARLPALATIDADARYASPPARIASEERLGEQLDELVELAPDRPFLRWLRASHASQRGDSRRAAEELVALRAAGHDTPVLRALAEKLLSEDPVERNRLVPASALPPAESPLDHALVGHTAHRQRDFDTSWLAWSRAIEAEPDEPLHREWRALVGLDAVDERSYVQDAARAEARLGRPTGRTLHVLAFAAWKDEPARAEELWRRCLELGGPQHQPLHNLGLLLLGQSQLEEAEEHLREAARVKPGSWKSFILLSRCAEARGDFAEADARLDAGLADLPSGAPPGVFLPVQELTLERANLHAEWAAELEELGEAEAARERREHALELLAPLLGESSSAGDALRLELESFRLALELELGRLTPARAVERQRALHADHIRSEGWPSPHIALDLGLALMAAGADHHAEAEALLLQGLAGESSRAAAERALDDFQ